MTTASADPPTPDRSIDPEAARRAHAAARDESARLHDADADGRDETSDKRDRAAERHEALHAPDTSAAHADTAATLRVAAAADRAQAALHRARAAVDRDRAAVDRDRSATERHQAGIDLRNAHGLDPTTTTTAAGKQTQGLIAGLRGDIAAHDIDIAELRARLDAAESELEDLRAIRDALTPPELPARPGLELAAAFLPATERVSGDFYLVAAGPEDSTVLVVGDVVGHGLFSARRASFVRTAFIATAPFSDDPAQLLSWVNTVLIERAGTTSEFITAACLTYRPSTRELRWAYAGHPPALWLDGGQELVAPQQGIPLGIHTELECLEGCNRADPGAGILLYTDGLTEARRHGKFLGLAAVSNSLASLHKPTPTEAITTLLTLAADHTNNAPTDDLCLLAARIAC